MFVTFCHHILYILSANWTNFYLVVKVGGVWPALHPCVDSDGELKLLPLCAAQSVPTLCHQHLTTVSPHDRSSHHSFILDCINDQGKLLLLFNLVDTQQRLIAHYCPFEFVESILTLNLMTANVFSLRAVVTWTENEEVKSNYDSVGRDPQAHWKNKHISNVLNHIHSHDCLYDRAYQPNTAQGWQCGGYF